MRKTWVHCYQGDTLLRSYDFGVAETLNDAALRLPPREDLEAEAKADRFTAHAHTVDSAERARLWPMMVGIYGPYAQYQTKTDRQIPIVVLTPVAAR
jgi:hypothetical protein